MSKETIRLENASRIFKSPAYRIPVIRYTQAPREDIAAHGAIKSVRSNMK